MIIINDTILVETYGNNDMINITDRLVRLLEKHKLKNGNATVFIPGSTAGITTIEYESGLKHDFSALLERIAPKNAHYYHEDTWNDGNGHSHVRASLIGPSLSIPFIDGEFQLGTWQQIIIVDFDIRPRSRKIVVQLLGQ